MSEPVEDTTIAPERRTKRRYAHELYAHADEGQVRPLAVEVPYLYARALGLDVDGTNWSSDDSELGRARSHERIVQLGDARFKALIADALRQGMTGDQAWSWAANWAWDYEGSTVWERAKHYGVDPMSIRPYPCNGEPSTHAHLGEPDGRGMQSVTYVDGTEESCEACTEEVPAEKPIVLTAADFEMRFDDAHTFPFFEDENGNGLWGFGHQDKAEFVRLVNEYDALCNGEPLIDTYDADDPQHVFYLAYTEMGATADEWRVRIVPEGTENSYPGTVIFR